MPGGFASNGYGANSPGGYGLLAAFLIEVILTAGFLVVILGSTAPQAPAGFAPIAIGLALTLIHLVSIPVTNTSVNPARSTAVAFFAETGALGQLWLFWVAPLIGGALGGVIWKALLPTRPGLSADAADHALPCAALALAPGALAARGARGALRGAARSTSTRATTSGRTTWR